MDKTIIVPRHDLIILMSSFLTWYCDSFLNLSLLDLEDQEDRTFDDIFVKALGYFEDYVKNNTNFEVK